MAKSALLGATACTPHRENARASDPHPPRPYFDAQASPPDNRVAPAGLTPLPQVPIALDAALLSGLWRAADAGCEATVSADRPDALAGVLTPGPACRDGLATAVGWRVDRRNPMTLVLVDAEGGLVWSGEAATRDHLAGFTPEARRLDWRRVPR